MYLLDTSVVSNFLDERRYYPQLTARILSQRPEQIFISIITVEEILQGALASVQKVKRKTSVTTAYQYFENLFTALPVGATTGSQSRLYKRNSPHSFLIIRHFVRRKTKQFQNHILKKGN
jgi:predicted nucleic acid-binding protein